MNADGAMDLINEIEEKFPVEQWRIDSIHIWPILRMQIYFDLRDLFVGSIQINNTKSPSLLKYFLQKCANVFKYLYSYSIDSQHNSKLHTASFIFLGDQVSRVLINGLWYDRLCEPIIEHFCAQGLKSFHMDPFHDYRTPRHNKTMFIQSLLDQELFRKYFFTQKIIFSAHDLKGFNDFVQFLSAQELNIRISGTKQIQRDIKIIKIYSNFFKKILSVINPRLGFIVDYRNLMGMAFNLACHEHGIKTVELPHGNHGELNVGYGRWNKIPTNGYELLPDIFWCWSENEARQIKKWSQAVFPYHKAIVGGNPWLDIWMKGESDIVNYYDQRVKEIKKYHPDKTHILITYEHNIHSMFDLIEASPSSWFWWIRLHPCHLHERRKWRKMIKENHIANFEFEEATDFPLYALLRHMDVHVSECSTTVIEAESFGVPSVMTTEYGAVAFPDQVSSGWTLPAYSRDEIIESIYKQLKNKEILKQHSRSLLPRVNIKDFLAQI